MASDHDLPFLWRLFHRLFVPYVLLGKSRASVDQFGRVGRKQLLIQHHFIFQVRYCRLLEEGDFRGRTANFVLMLSFGIAAMTLVASYADVPFLGSALTFMMIYVWGRRNEDVKMSFLGFFTFHAPYLPYVMLGFSVLLGNSVKVDLIGILVGHCYYFLEYVFPVLAEVRGWPIKRLMEPPVFLHWLCGSYEEGQHLHQD